MHINAKGIMEDKYISKHVMQCDFLLSVMGRSLCLIQDQTVYNHVRIVYIMYLNHRKQMQYH